MQTKTTTVKNGFTLIELVMVIVILGILAAFALPKFVNFKTRAIERSEDAIAGALNSAIKIYQTSYITAGGDPTTYPAINPFTLLEQVPPYCATIWVDPLIPDGSHWMIRTGLSTAFYIFCPHRDGLFGGGSATKGRFYIYQFGDTAGWGHRPGDFWLFADQGH